MELLLQQVLAGLANGAIYALMALAVVMIYQAIDHLNFAQGEMAMFSTFIAWQLIAWGQPYWVAFAISVIVSFVAGILIDRVLFRPISKAPILSQLVAFIALFSILNSSAGEIWNFTIKTFPTPFGREPLFGVPLISTHEAGMIGVTLVMLGLLYLFFRGSRLGLAMRGAVAGGFAVGVIENLAGTFIPYFGRELKLTIALMLIVAVLLVRPSGVFGRAVVSRD